MNNYRWNPYVLLSGQELESCFSEHFTAESKVLLIMSKGFDVRMNIAISELKKNQKKPKITVILISFDEGEDSSSHEYKHLVDANMTELAGLVNHSDIVVKHIDLWQMDDGSKRRVGDRRAARLIDEIDIVQYNDIIVDISALPRGIYFSLIGKLLSLIDNLKIERKPNLMVTVAENPELDEGTIDDTVDDEPNFLAGFSGSIDRSSSGSGEPLIWMPILGEYKIPHIKKAHGFLAPNETCPILPFPSKNPRRPDALIIDYHNILFDEFNVEQQNIMYVPEQNPFEAYKILSKAIKNYRKSLKEIGECKTVISTFSSKLLSIGTLLAAYELKTNDIDVGVLNVDSQGYKLKGDLDLKKMRDDSNLFVIWLTGEPYENFGSNTIKS
ncbi:hypothetical protein [Pedobacter antarcticus]|uniref:hypothetical protein n=1 Tax=Pedobacter antarcticus TaxID=34086 RepID=UPI00293047AF|nr:hypothetical protein [Pedobacter antarcticus]